MVSNYVSEDDRCFICGNDQLHLLDSHHIVPDRYGGSDDQFNRVTLCKNCHGAVERIYTDSVFNRLGVPKVSKEPEEHGEMTMERFKTLDTPEQFEYLHRNAPQPDLRFALEMLYRDKFCEGNEYEAVCETIGRNKDDEPPYSPRKRTLMITEIVEDAQRKYDRRVGAPNEEVYDAIEKSKMETELAVDHLQKLIGKGEMYRVDQDHIRTM